MQIKPQNPASLQEKRGLGIQFIESPLVGVKVHYFENVSYYHKIILSVNDSRSFRTYEDGYCPFSPNNRLLSCLFLNVLCDDLDWVLWRIGYLDG